MNGPEIVVVGSYNLDLVFQVARLPAPGETCVGASRLQNAGGKGSNQAIQAARCGARVAMIGAVGGDAAGDEALAVWAAESVDARGVARLADAETGTAVILVDAQGENAIVVASGANARLSAAHVEAAGEIIGAAHLVVGQLEVPHAATGAALTGLADPAQIGAALLETVPTVLVTLGAQGAVLFERGREPVTGAPFPVQAVDTTGAGDAFIGAFAARLAQGETPSAALPWGLAAGALACTVRGVLAGFAPAARIGELVATRE
jgi:ribokinase